jgi:N-acetylmuramoyl-L-alanine amidase
VALPPGNTTPAPPLTVPPQPQALPPDLSGLTAPATSIRTIAIDAGHGGEDVGAVGPGGTKEKDITLAVARRLKSVFEGRLGIRVLLTRDDDRNVPLDDRSAAANNNKADAFISLHASASPRSTATGASILFAAFDRDTEDAARGSGASGAAIDSRLQTAAGVTRDLELVVWDLAQTRHVDQSADFARFLEDRFREHVPLSAHAIERAPLRVLESANMPAVLIEMGYLSNAGQEKQLLSNEFQTAFVQAVLDAVLHFRDSLDAAARATAQAGTQPRPGAGATR